MKKANQINLRLRHKLRTFSERFRALARLRQDMPNSRLAGNANDQWLAQSDDLTWQQYGDGGDCWWPGQR